MRTEIWVEGKRLDISTEISGLLTFAIDDVKNFASRSTAFSKTIVLPGTGNNNAIFGNIFEIGISNEYDPSQTNIGYNFNPSKSARCIIFQDFLQTFKGTIRMLEIVKEKNNIEYEMALNGEITGLNVALSSGLLSDLDFSEYNMAYNYANIVASWDNTPGSGVYFPLIDYGTYSVNKHDWDFRTFRPALYVKEYIDKMFDAANFRYICSLFDTERFKKMVVPHNQKRLIKLSSNIVSASRDTQVLVVTNEAPFQWGLTFNSVAAGLFDYNSLTGLFTYNGTDTISTTLKLSVAGYYHFEEVDPSMDFRCTIVLRKNGATYYDDGDALEQNNSHDLTYARNWEIPITLANGETFQVFYRLTFNRRDSDKRGEVFATSATLSLDSTAEVASPIDYNEEIDMNMALPQNIRQVDFLLSIIRLFNIYVYESQWDERVILMSPFVSFYDGTAMDWTYKMNRDSPIRIRPMSELNSKIYEFKYRDDSDYFNDLYKKRYNLGYGAHVFDSEFEFASQKTTTEIIFAPTPLVGYNGEDKVYSTIFKRTGPDNAPVEETIDSVIRILQTKKIESVTSWVMKNDFTTLGTLTKYGYAGHYDDPTNPDNDLNFGVPKELFFELTTGDLTKTQFNLYWSSYMYEITDKDSKLLIAKFYLTPIDIFNLRFQTYVFVDGALFRLNKIIDYNMNEPSDCTVELLKVINTVYGFPPNQIPPSEPSNFLEWITGDPILHSDDDEIEYN